MLAQRCTTLVDSISVTAKPERVTATNLPAGNYALVIVNEGPGREAGTFQLLSLGEATSQATATASGSHG